MSTLQKSSGRVGEMEFLRFLFSVIIVLHHSRNFIGNETSPFFNGAFAVEFFFILSGFLMMKSLSKLPAASEHLGLETARFIKKKYLSLCPDMLVSWVIGVVVTAVACEYSLTTIVKTAGNGIWELGLLHMTGLRFPAINNAVWYLSSMLLCMAILYPLLRKHKTTATFVIVPLLTLLLFGYLAVEFKSIRVPFGWAEITYRGNLRAFADLGVGVMLYHATEAFKAKKLTVFSKVILTVVKYAGILALVGYMYYIRKPTIQYDLSFIVVIAVVIGLVFSRQTYGERLFNNRLAAFLGTFSLPLYLSHYYWANVLKFRLPETFDKTTALGVYLLISFATAGVVMVISALIKKYKPFAKLKPLFAKP